MVTLTLIYTAGTWSLRGAIKNVQLSGILKAGEILKDLGRQIGSGWV